MKNKGFTLIEMMVVLAILSIIMMSALEFLRWFNLSIAKAKKKADQIKIVQMTNPATAPGADERNFVPVLNQCIPMKGTNGVWFAKRTEARTVAFFTSSNCVAGSLGTLSALNNPTYDDTITDTFWNVSGDGTTLRVLVRKLNLKK